MFRSILSLLILVAFIPVFGELPQRSSPEPAMRLFRAQILALGQAGGDPWANGQNFSIKSIDRSFQKVSVRLWPILSVPAKSDPYTVTQNFDSVILQNSEGIEVFKKGSGKPLAIGKTIKINVTKDRVEIGQTKLKLEALDFRPLSNPKTKLLQPTTVLSENATVSAQYRGDFRVEYSLHEVVDRWTQVVTYSGQHWSLMNEVSVEDYLAAVVPSEMPASFGEEALKAQAVAARTYVVFHSWLARKILGRTWDVDPTTWFQSYRGAQVENALILSAVKATTGEILISSDKVIEAFFSANSGGVVCRISECFWLPDRPYAVTKNDVAGVREKPGGRWTSKVTSQGVWDRLQKIESEGRLSLAQLAPHLQGPQDITALEAERLGESGRTWQLSIMSKSGPAVILNEEFTREMRWQFGFKTSFYNMTGTNKLGMQLVEGYGLGHGVGMSQWGATLLAAEGRVYTDILKFYYEGVTVARLP